MNIISPAGCSARWLILVVVFVCTANLPTDIVDFKGFDSSIILLLRGGIPRPIGDFPESLSQAILVGIMLLGRLGVLFTVFCCLFVYVYYGVYWAVLLCCLLGCFVLLLIGLFCSVVYW